MPHMETRVFLFHGFLYRERIVSRAAAGMRTTTISIKNSSTAATTIAAADVITDAHHHCNPQPLQSPPQRDVLPGGHVIMLGKGNEEAAMEALKGRRLATRARSAAALLTNSHICSYVDYCTFLTTPWPLLGHSLATADCCLQPATLTSQPFNHRLQRTLAACRWAAGSTRTTPSSTWTRVSHGHCHRALGVKAAVRLGGRVHPTMTHGPRPTTHDLLPIRCEPRDRHLLRLQKRCHLVR